MAQVGRNWRSNVRAPALDRWLAQFAKRSALDGLVLADEQGELVAASIDGPQAVELAAEVRRVADNPLAATMHHMIVVRKVVLGDQLFLGVLGDRGLAFGGLPEVWSGVQRILFGPETLPGPF